MSTSANQLVTTTLSATNAPGTPHIAVVGVGGAGGNAINTMIENGGFPSHIHFVAANTDRNPVNALGWYAERGGVSAEEAARRVSHQAG